jgi:hypothetical protein
MDDASVMILRASFFILYWFQIIEKFFDTRAAAPPYKPNALSGFGRMLNVPYNVLKDFVQIMKLELVSEYRDFYPEGGNSMFHILILTC